MSFDVSPETLSVNLQTMCIFIRKTKVHIDIKT